MRRVYCLMLAAVLVLAGCGRSDVEVRDDPYDVVYDSAVEDRLSLWVPPGWRLLDSDELLMDLYGLVRVDRAPRDLEGITVVVYEPRLVRDDVAVEGRPVFNAWEHRDADLNDPVSVGEGFRSLPDRVIGGEPAFGMTGPQHGDLGTHTVQVWRVARHDGLWIITVYGPADGSEPSPELLSVLDTISWSSPDPCDQANLLAPPDMQDPWGSPLPSFTPSPLPSWCPSTDPSDSESDDPASREGSVTSEPTPTPSVSP